MNQTPPLIFDARSNVTKLIEEIGRGGEGTVYGTDNPAFAAKIYHSTPSVETSEKLRAMTTSGSDRLSGISAWPSSIVHGRHRGETLGFLMPRIAGLKDIHRLYSPKNRVREFPTAGWGFLFATAANVARAFRVVHDAGHVIGDVNHGNVVVAADATVRLIDCDSFQIENSGRVYTCDVGISTHTPPELQGRALRGLRRTQQHDVFGLAVTIFQLLFMGRHPFSGRYSKDPQDQLERAIAEYRFAYGKQAEARGMTTPPNTLSADALPAPLFSLFERAFGASSSTGGRPSAAEWVGELEQVLPKMRTCSQYPLHQFALESCPWCEMENVIGISFFARPVVSQSGVARPELSLADLLARIGQLPPASPGRPPPVSSTAPSPAAISSHRKALASRSALWAFILSAGVAASWATGITSGLCIMPVAWFLATEFVGTITKTTSRPFRDRMVECDARRSSLITQWESELGRHDYARHRAALDAAAERLRTHDARVVAALASLQIDARRLRLHRYLDAFQLASAKVEGIGAGRLSVLESHGVESAADVVEGKLRDVPGIGPKLMQALLDWRWSIEQRFVWNPSSGVDPQDRADLMRRLDREKSDAGRDARRSMAQAESVAAAFRARTAALHERLGAVEAEFAQIKRDVDLLS